MSGKWLFIGFLCVEYGYDTGSNACMHVISACMVCAKCMAMPARYL